MTAIDLNDEMTLADLLAAAGVPVTANPADVKIVYAGCGSHGVELEHDPMVDELPAVSQRAVAGLLIRYSLACESEGIGPDDRGQESEAVDRLVWGWAEGVRPDLAELEAR